MARYQVDSEAVIGAHGAIQNTIGRLQAEVGNLHGQLANLEGSWSGPAASAFQAVVGEWKATEQRVEQNLAGINQALGRAGQQYADIELANAQMFRQ